MVKKRAMAYGGQAPEVKVHGVNPRETKSCV